MNNKNSIFNYLIVTDVEGNLDEMLEFADVYIEEPFFNGNANGVPDKLFPIPSELKRIYFNAAKRSNSLGKPNGSADKIRNVSDLGNEIIEKPLPVGLIKKYGCINLLEWCVDNWGAIGYKHSNFNFNGRNKVELLFWTTTGVPIGLILRASELYKSLRFELHSVDTTESSYKGMKSIIIQDGSQVLENASQDGNNLFNQDDDDDDWFSNWYKNHNK